MYERMSLGGCSPLLIVLILFWMQSLTMALMALTVSLYPSASRGCRYCRGIMTGKIVVHVQLAINPILMQ